MVDALEIKPEKPEKGWFGRVQRRDSGDVLKLELRGSGTGGGAKRRFVGRKLVGEREEDAEVETPREEF